MYIHRVRTMKAKSSLQRYIKLDLVRVVMLMMLGILLMDCAWGHYRDQLNVHAKITPINQPTKPKFQQQLKLSSVQTSSIDENDDQDTHSMMVDRDEFARQLALSILVNHQHEITDYRVSFLRDPKKSGTALKQFANTFGRAIEQGVTGHELTKDDQLENSSNSVQ